jgi:hypothetical protein
MCAFKPRSSGLVALAAQDGFDQRPPASPSHLDLLDLTIGCVDHVGSVGWLTIKRRGYIDFNFKSERVCKQFADGFFGDLAGLLLPDQPHEFRPRGFGQRRTQFFDCPFDPGPKHRVEILAEVGKVR